MSLGGQPANAPLSARNVQQGTYAQLAATTYYSGLGSGYATALSGASVSVSPTGRSNGTAYVGIYVAAVLDPGFVGGWHEFYGGVKVDGGAQYQLGRVWSNGWEFAVWQGMMPLGVTPGAHTFQVYVGANTAAGGTYNCNSFTIGVWEI